MGKPLCILIADDHDGFRESLAAFLKGMPLCEVVGEAKDGSEAEEMALRLSPEIVLMDVVMPEMNGIEASSRIKMRRPTTYVILYSMHDLQAFGAEALNAADKFIPKQRLFDEILPVLRAYERGDKRQTT